MHEVSLQIAKDMADDAKYYEGMSFTGRNVAEYFGKQGAAIAALADITTELLNDKLNQTS